MKGKYMPISYNWLQSFFDKPLPSAQDLAQIITTGTFEIEEIAQEGNDWALDVKVLPDRAADSFSHRGIAHTVSVLTGLACSDPFLRMPTVASIDSGLLLKNETPLCTSHAIARVSNVSVMPSPAWLRERLETIGQRSINNVVDATNYVMFELGQPIHVFDYDKLTEQNGARGIYARESVEGETLTLLGGQKVTLHAGTVVLADAVDNRPLDIAGIKGGTAAELTTDTKNILITIAHYDWASIRKTARAVNIHTEASKRFGNGIPEALVGFSAERVVQLIIELAGGTLNGYQLYNLVLPQTRVLTVTADRINGILGTHIDPLEIQRLLEKQGFVVSGDAEFLVTVPFERTDIAIAEDFAEEVARVYGYNTIPDTPLPAATLPLRALASYAAAESLRVVLAAHGFTEVMTYSLGAKGSVRLKNSFASDKAFLRESLVPGITEALTKNEYNAPLIGEYEAVKIFEIGSVFLADETEDVRVCIGARMLGGKNKEARANELVQTILAALSIRCDSKNGIAEFSLKELSARAPDEYANNTGIDGVSYKPFSVYPFVLRDIAFWAPENTDSAEVLRTITENAGALLVRNDLFDTFSKDGRTSYAYHLVFQSMERTLTDDEVGGIMQNVEQVLRAKGYEVR